LLELPRKDREHPADFVAQAKERLDVLRRSTANGARGYELRF
jgi:hypothetical protein